MRVAKKRYLFQAGALRWSAMSPPPHQHRHGVHLIVCFLSVNQTRHTSRNRVQHNLNADALQILAVIDVQHALDDLTQSHPRQCICDETRRQAKGTKSSARRPAYPEEAPHCGVDAHTGSVDELIKQRAHHGVPGINVAKAQVAVHARSHGGVIRHQHILMQTTSRVRHHGSNGMRRCAHRP